MIGYWLLVAHIFALANVFTGRMSRRRTSAHKMTLNPADRGSDATLSDEEAMATYYSIERDYGQKDEDLPNGIYRHNIRSSQKGYPKAGSSQSVCKYRHSLPRRPCSLHVVECKVRFVRGALGALGLKIAFITNCFGCLIWQVTGISKYITSNGRSREWLMGIQSIPDIAPPLFTAICGGIPRAEVQERTSVHTLWQPQSEGGTISGFECSLKQWPN